MDKLDELYKLMCERSKHLESQEQTDETKYRIREITLAIVKIQQLILGNMTTKPGNKIESVKKLMDQMSDNERMEIMDNYCTHCGCKDPRCQCWNDE